MIGERSKIKPNVSHRIAGFDGLRGMACISVFCVHFQQLSQVDFVFGPFDFSKHLDLAHMNGFFLLSGALLSLPFWLHRDPCDCPQGVGHSSVSNYMIRRLTRLIPAYYLCLIGLAFIKRAWRSHQIAWDFVMHGLFVHNFFEQYFYSLSPPFWTIGIQMQFYLIFPLLLYIVKSQKFGQTSKRLILCLLILVSYLVHCEIMEHGFGLFGWKSSYVWVETHPTVFSHSFLAHLPHFVLGVLIGSFLVDNQSANDHRLRMNRWDLLSLVLFVLLIVILGTQLEHFFIFPHGRYHFPFVSILVGTLIVSISKARSIQRTFEHWIFKKMGMLSFGFYVYHYSVLVAVSGCMNRLGYSVHQYWWVFWAFSFLGTWLVAFLSYFLVEQKINRWITAIAR